MNPPLRCTLLPSLAHRSCRSRMDCLHVTATSASRERSKTARRQASWEMRLFRAARGRSRLLFTPPTPTPQGHRACSTNAKHSEQLRPWHLSQSRRPFRLSKLIEIVGSGILRTRTPYHSRPLPRMGALAVCLRLCCVLRKPAAPLSHKQGIDTSALLRNPP